MNQTTKVVTHDNKSCHARKTFLIRMVLAAVCFFPAVSVLAQERIALTGYYSPIVDHRGFWRHGISGAAEYRYENYSFGPRYTLAHVDSGEWYGDEHLLGVHLSRHFHLKHWLEPHAHLELGYSWTKFKSLAHRSERGAYYGTGFSLGWRLPYGITLQVPQYTHLEFYTGPHRRQELIAAGFSVRL